MMPTLFPCSKAWCYFRAETVCPFERGVQGRRLRHHRQCHCWMQWWEKVLYEVVGAPSLPNPGSQSKISLVGTSWKPSELQNTWIQFAEPFLTRLECLPWEINVPNPHVLVPREFLPDAHTSLVRATRHNYTTEESRTVRVLREHFWKMTKTETLNG